MTLDEFEKLVHARRAARRFRPDPIPAGLLERLLDLARWYPNGYNLQPTHFFVVDDPALKPALQRACLGQKQVLEAPAVVVFAGDRRADRNHFEKVLAEDLKAGAISEDYAAFLRRKVPLAFDQGPLGLGWLGKALLTPLIRLSKPTPSVPAVHKRYWVTKQVMLSAMIFMLGATAAGLATSPMEGFDERRVKRVLGIPGNFIVPVVVCIGYAQEGTLKKTRLPLKDVLHDTLNTYLLGDDKN